MLSPHVIAALYRHTHHIYAEDIAHELRDQLPTVSVAEVEETLRRFKLAGLVDEQKSPVNFDSRWRLTDEAIKRATATGLRVLAINANADGGKG